MNHPHRIQKIIPELHLPRGVYMTNDSFPLSHPVDDSDIAFVIRLSRNSTACPSLGNPSIARYRLGTAIDPFINLVTVNYLLAGLQLCVNRYDTEDPCLWKTFLHDISQDRFQREYFEQKKDISFDDIVHIVRELITPFGVVRGSEQQGGQDEMINAGSIWPVNFVTTMVIDGHERNIVNYWYNKDVDAGDDLVFRLKPMPVPDMYTLNHYYQGISRQDFKSVYSTPNRNCTVTHVWQLVPDILDLKAYKETNDNMVFGNPLLNPPKNYYWQEHGFWHIGRSQKYCSKFSTQGDYYNDDMAMNMRIGHLEMTFSPCWQKLPSPKKDKRAISIPMMGSSMLLAPSQARLGMESIFANKRMRCF